MNEPTYSKFLVAAAAGAALAACGSTAATTPTSSSASPATVTVSTTLDGLTALPHRIHWQAFPHAAGADVATVEYRIDGKQLWVERNAPYYYGDDGNYLVTSFLPPGSHTFEVQVLTTSGRSASDTVTASVPAGTVPAALVGTWTGFAPAQAGGPPAGTWKIVISATGWQVLDTAGTGALYDVVYPSPGSAMIQTGMATGHDKTDGNAWCNESPGDKPAGRRPVRIEWSVAGRSLTVKPQGDQSGSCGFTDFLRTRGGGAPVSWTRQ